MHILRWLLCVPVSVAILPILTIGIRWLLGLIYKVLYYIVFWGTRCDVPSVFDFQNHINDFKTFIFVTCLSTIIASGMAGYIGGLIQPPTKSNITYWLFGILGLPVFVCASMSFWNTLHWFYSLLWIIDMLICWGSFVVFASISNEKNLLLSAKP